jgi:hypothetical protein
MRLFQLTGGVASALLLTGCYALRPVAGTAPLDGRQVAFDVSDAGRVALGSAIGPSVARIGGRLLRRESDEYVVSVTSVDFLGGGTQTWSGETVRLKPGHVGVMYERRLSKERTLVAAAIGVGAVALIATRSVVGGGDPVIRPNPTDSTGTTSRGRRP